MIYRDSWHTWTATRVNTDVLNFGKCYYQLGKCYVLLEVWHM